MNIEKEIRNCKDLIKFDKSMIIHAIAESFKKYDNNEKLKDKDIFLLGLRYPEMLCNDNDDEKSLLSAYNRAEIYHNKLGIDFNYLRYNLDHQYGIK